MSKKVLNTESVINELRGQSAFFKPQAPIQSEADTSKTHQAKKAPAKTKRDTGKSVEKEKSLSHQGHSPASLPVEKKNDNLNNSDSNRESLHASTLANDQDDIVETIRKTIKQVGKETLYVRLTPDEKHQISSIVYALNEMHRGESRKTSENEIGRIGVNFLLEDYKVNGKGSILAKVLDALNA